MIKELIGMLKDQGISYNKLGDWGISIHYMQVIDGLHIPGILVLYNRGDNRIVLHERKVCKSAIDAYASLCLQLKKRDAWVGKKQFRNI